MDSESKCSFTFWDSCHEDILMHIFQELDLDSLLQCFDVNKHWRKVADTYAQHYRKWTYLAEKILPEDVWNDKINKCSHTMDYRHWCINARLWRFINLADIKLKIIKTFDSLKMVHILKDSLMLTHSPELYRKYYRIDNELNSMKEIYPQVKSETQFSLDDCAQNSIHVDPGNMFLKFDDNRFYILENGGIISYGSDPKRMKLLARYYGPRSNICHIHIQKDVAYMLLDNITVMRSEFLQFNVIKVNIIEESETDFAKAYPKFCNELIVLHDGKFKFLVVPRSMESGKVKDKYLLHMIHVPGITCVMQLSDLLLVGYNFGAVHIYKLNGLNEVKALFLKIQDYEEIRGQNKAVVSVDVQEDINCQYLYVAMESKLLKFLIAYPEHVINNAVFCISMKDA